MSQDNSQASGRLPVSAGLILGVLCFLWGAQSVSIKFSNQGMPPLMAAALRSLVAGALVWGYARAKGRRVVFPPGQTRHAMMIGLLFGLEFLFLYWCLVFTPVSRSLIFFYTHPFWVALGAHFFLRNDRLTPTKLFGLIIAFVGVVVVFKARSPELPASYWIGDIMALFAAIFWAATTLYIKRISEKVVLDHFQTLFAQLIYSFPVLAIGSFFFRISCRSKSYSFGIGLAFLSECRGGVCILSGLVLVDSQTCGEPPGGVYFHGTAFWGYFRRSCFKRARDRVNLDRFGLCGMWCLCCEPMRRETDWAYFKNKIHRICCLHYFNLADEMKNQGK